MSESIFEKALREREKDQEDKKAANGLVAKPTADRISLSLPSDCKQKFVEYCENHYTTPSAQLRAWIDQFCN